MSDSGDIKGCFVLHTIRDYKVEIRTVLFYNHREEQALKDKYLSDEVDYLSVDEYELSPTDLESLSTIHFDGIVLHYVGEDPVYLMTLNATKCALNLYGSCNLYRANRLDFDYHSEKKEFKIRKQQDDIYESLKPYAIDTKKCPVERIILR